MDDIISKNNEIDLIDFDVEVLSPRDPRYAIHFLTKSLNDKLSEADAFAESIYNAVIKEASTASQIAQSFENVLSHKLRLTQSVRKERLRPASLRVLTIS